MDNLTAIEEPVDHVANAVKNTQQQLSIELKQMQAMMQVIQMQYAAVPQNSHQDYGGRGYHRGHSNYRGQGGRGTQHRGNWRGGRGGRVNSYLTHYCYTHGMCAHQGKYCRNPAEEHKKDMAWCNKIL